MKTKSITLSILLIGISIGSITSIGSSPTSVSAYTSSTSNELPKKIMISREDISLPLSIPTYELNSNKIQKTSKKLNILNKEKTQLKTFYAKKISVHNRVYWKLANNKIIDDKRVVIIK
ncbi:hypothetical protein [Companilactobacillus ginsenosidimutans]|uniref:Surface layer protein A domain-containing protein n=1 Tax=Companilactobacillus ginsenosidimutans TaxID=1007676 RepID=A0A0H4QLF1_9LACO|nr:hypothetical protein [Companilactobacillus ginsenosidimutans]AKP67911.1 hypothetical protein ABM34_10470 [Companilactobacillus ginsenosidimutans]